MEEVKLRNMKLVIISALIVVLLACSRASSNGGGDHSVKDKEITNVIYPTRYSVIEQIETAHAYCYIYNSNAISCVKK